MSVKKYRKKPVEIEAMQMPYGYPEGVDPSSDNYAGNIQAYEVYSWVEENTAGSFDCLPIIRGDEDAFWPESGVSIDPRDGRMIIATLEGGHWVDLGDYVIRGVQGEFYPCKPGIFAATYEESRAAHEEKGARLMIVEPDVTLLAHTVINDDVIAELMDIQPQSTDAETLVTFAGRSCYESWHRPRPETYHDRDYIGRTIFEQQHGSILEHATATLYFTGVSRAFLTELTRHRTLSFSVRSQRFVDEAGANIVLPPIYRSDKAEPGTALSKAAELLEGIAQDLDSHYEGLVVEAGEDGHKRKQAREAARAILPNMTETKMVVTGNLRAWLQVIERRTAPDADAELQEVMGMAREVLKPLAPSIFGRDNN